MVVDAELAHGSEAMVTITNADGEIIASGHGHVSVGFKRHKPADAPDWDERTHSIKLA